MNFISKIFQKPLTVYTATILYNNPVKVYVKLFHDEYNALNWTFETVKKLIAISKNIISQKTDIVFNPIGIYIFEDIYGGIFIESNVECKKIY
jgi:hypothetical protein